MDRISRIFSGGRVPHSFLITGEPSAGKAEFALRLARALICEGETPPCGACRSCKKTAHPDLIDWLSSDRFKDGKFDINDVRDMIADANILPNDAQRKVYLIPDAPRLTIPQQNVLLATLESPPKHVCYILTATHASDLIPTVVSRCTQIKLTGHGINLPGLDAARKIITPLSQKDEFGVFAACAALEKIPRDELREILEACRTLLRDGALKTLQPLAEADAPAFTHAEFLACADALDQAVDGVHRNLGVAIILGALSVRLISAVTEASR